MITLSIDTSSNKKIVVGLTINGKKDLIKQEMDKQKAQVVLPMVDALLRKHKLKLADIDEIHAETGPGSFTGLRVGVAVANALGFALKIPVNGQKVWKEAIITPIYS